MKRPRQWFRRVLADVQADALRRAVEDLEAEAARLSPPVRLYHYPEQPCEPYRTTAYVGEPIREVEAS